MTVNTGIRLKTPAHPGSFIRHEIIEPLGLSVTSAAEVLGVTRATLSTLLNERAPSVTGNGIAGGEGFRRRDGHVDADAEQLRHCADPQTCSGNQSRAIQR